MRRTRKIVRALLVSALLTLGMAVTVYADVMQGVGHLEAKSTACAGPFFIDGANGGFIVTGTTTPNPGTWTVLQSGDCSFTTTTTIFELTDTQLSQFISAPTATFPGCFKLCVTGKNKKIDYTMLMDSGPF